MTLYQYIHCPFCVRIRMTLSFFSIPYKSHILSYKDERTPVELMGKKMLPIFEFDDGTLLNESLDIIQKLDKENILQSCDLIRDYPEKMSPLLNTIGRDVHSLAMPYWIWTPEFDNESREYFQKKKEEKRGPFKELISKRESFIKGLNTTLNELNDDLVPFYKSEKITLNDILLASHLLGMYTVHEFQFEEAVHSYLQRVQKSCRFSYHQGLWEAL